MLTLARTRLAALCSLAAMTLALAARPALAAGAERIGDPYPLATCPVSGESLTEAESVFAKLYDGREITFCCAMCVPKFEKDLAASLAAVDTKIMDDQRPLYPLTTSLVTGATLPDHPYEFVYGNRLIRLGAESEKADFLKDAAKFFAELNKAVIAAQGPSYPLKNCPVSDEELSAKHVDMVVASRLIRVCCKSCVADVEDDPAYFIAEIDAARAAAH